MQDETEASLGATQADMGVGSGSQVADRRPVQRGAESAHWAACTVDAIMSPWPTEGYARQVSKRRMSIVFGSSATWSRTAREEIRPRRTFFLLDFISLFARIRTTDGQDVPDWAGSDLQTHKLAEMTAPNGAKRPCT